MCSVRVWVVIQSSGSLTGACMRAGAVDSFGITRGSMGLLAVAHPLFVRLRFVVVTSIVILLDVLNVRIHIHAVIYANCLSIAERKRIETRI